MLTPALFSAPYITWPTPAGVSSPFSSTILLGFDARQEGIFIECTDTLLTCSKNF